MAHGGIHMQLLPLQMESSSPAIHMYQQNAPILSMAGFSVFQNEQALAKLH